MAGLNIHRNDTVQVLSGSDAGKRGRVLRVFPDKDRILVEHVRVVKKTISAKSGNTQGGIAEQESPLHVSNVALVCSNCGKATRVGFKVEGDTKTRICKKCGTALPTKAK